MNAPVVLCLALACLLYGGNAITITFTNNCQFTVWPGTLNGASSPALSTTGFELGTGASKSLDVPSPWSGRFWARTGCSGGAGNFNCATANCGSGQVECNGNGGATPATLVEITVAANGGQDFYDVSNVDGFNLPVSMAPQGGTGTCKVSSCKANINSQCPDDLKVTGSDGSVIACKSACVAYGKPEYCCSGDYNNPQKCQPTNYSQFFSNLCPEAYSYAYDDIKGTFTCNGGPNYAITFCP
ncbi:thaumatin-like protein 1b [Prosopis cineraria]|uniref:thaumatin-like protein 1b n=1 Tax=Prosopis cineraria TaxID=364024 RepID=UPI00241025B1|nr:thaumatin-like protein 1b [Prosopis cineraria]